MNFLTAPAAGGMGSTMFMLVAMLAIMYFLMIRPENKRKKESEQMRNSLKKGDKIITIGGIVGKIVSVGDEYIVIETSDDRVRLELTKWAVSSNLSRTLELKGSKKGEKKEETGTTENK